MSTETNPDDVPVNIISENQSEINSDKIIPEDSEINSKEYKSSQTNEELVKLLDIEKQNVIEIDEKLKHVLADFQNLNKKTQSDIQNGVNTKVDEFVLDFLKIYDDFIRAKEVFSENKINTDGLDSIL